MCYPAAHAHGLAGVFRQLGNPGIWEGVHEFRGSGASGGKLDGYDIQCNRGGRTAIDSSEENNAGKFNM